MGEAVRGQFRIALGGIGGDCHSVGISILRHALEVERYTVIFMGNQNQLRDFFVVGADVDVVMISTLDGHSRFYTREFAGLLREFPHMDPLWYIGGNLAIGGKAEIVRYYYELGFARVFCGYVDIRDVLRCLRVDLSIRRPRGARVRAPQPATSTATTEVQDEILERDVFLSGRRKVLDQWRTGRDAADVECNAAFLARSPLLATAQRRARAEGRPLVQPRCGVASLRGQLALFTALRRGGADVLSYQVDSLSRVNDYRGAQTGIDASMNRLSVLNGFPVVNHGVERLRAISGRLKVPLQTRHSTRDPRLLAEISYASGVSGFEGGCISYNIPYYRDYPLSESIAVWQYVDYLTGLYAKDYGVVLDREFFGVLTGTLLPPCLGIVVDLIEMILAVRQGVRSVSLGYAEQGCRAQDVAAVQVLDELAHVVLHNLGYPDVLVNIVFHQYMAAFPSELDKAEKLILGSAQTAGLAGCTRILVKTPAEALGVPDLESNLRGLKLVQEGLDQARTLPARLDLQAVKVERRIIREEVEQLLAEVFAKGGGSLASGVAAAFATGALDIPFSPSRHNSGRVLTARDATGAVRFLNPGGLPLSSDLRAFHRERVEDQRSRETQAGRLADAELVSRHVRQIPDGRFSAWPLDG